VARLRRLFRIQASRSPSPSHYPRQRSALQPFLDSDFFDCPVLSNGTLRGVLDGGHNEIGHGAPLKFSGALEHRMQIGADPGFRRAVEMGMVVSS